MEIPYLYLATKNKQGFSYQEGYEGIDTEEIRTLLELAQQTVSSLKAELNQRSSVSDSTQSATRVSSLETELNQRSSVDNLPQNARNCVLKIQRTRQELDALHRIDDSRYGLISAAAKVMRHNHTARREKIYKEFLVNIRDHCSPGLAVLCSKALGKRNIIGLNKQERLSLVNYLMGNFTNLQHSILEEYAAKLGISPSATPAAINTAAAVPHAEIERRDVPNLPTPDVVEYKLSEASVECMELLGPELAKAVKASWQYRFERSFGEKSRTDCIQGLMRKNGGDITLQLLLGFDEGNELIGKFNLNAL